MATVTHYIHSDYDPTLDRERLQLETGQVAEGSDQPVEENDPWQTEPSFGVRRRLANAPRFVPATLSYDEWGNIISPGEHTEDKQAGGSKDVAGWYRALTRQSVDQKPTLSPNPISSSSRARSTSVPPPLLPQPASSLPPKSRSERHQKLDWFSRTLPFSSAPVTPAPPSTLAEILARNPPAPQPLTPPVFLHLGPSNKGWEMLQRHGWTEGEGLGSGVIRRGNARAEEAEALERERSEGSPSKKKGRKDAERVLVKQESNLEDDITQITERQIIDLTLSDSEDLEVPEAVSRSFPSDFGSQPEDVADGSPSTRTTLLTPLPTILKSDRLGIGLKAKTEGPYRASVKRVTHSAAALAAHIKSGEKSRRRKQLLGKGRRAFERRERRERAQRKEMMAYLNER
ncbi:hypothetical protein EW146_g1195 [Bondarzewia mesenterica]|uniref:G-patch domain-containing protein n=1 Tax=Bondarzewia mesenterica TaxID=1095465 RepID=A0A4S4M4K0_9AGAM|nr:hypothetical protein EW146_g1195 [Bondarzewia mesenterica]